MSSPFNPLMVELTTALTDQARQHRLLAPLLLALCEQLRRLLLVLDALFARFQAGQLAPHPAPIRRATPPRTRRLPRPYVLRRRPRPIRRAIARVRTSAPPRHRATEARAIQHPPQHPRTVVNRHRR